MITTIDQAGRVVIPKALRAQFHFEPGSQIELVAEGNGLRIRLPEPEARFCDKDGVLVQCSDRVSSLDSTAFINRLREQPAVEIMARKSGA